ncbi:unnamed protein product [Schistosoma turkestanicum]|nr:unnamed protein product [Schistosoma turkestanicum]
MACSYEYLKAFTSASNLNLTGIKCIKYVLTGAAAAISHSSISFISAKATGQSESSLNHALGGAVSGLICTWKSPITVRVFVCAGFAIVSALGKYEAQLKEKYPEWHVPKVGERYPAPYASLNHRWMNKNARQEEEMLEMHL